jgi:cytochrome c2
MTAPSAFSTRAYFLPLFAHRRVIPLQGALAIVLFAPWVAGQDTPDYFRQNCMNCHSIGGGRLTGPDLKDVGKRKDTEWLISFMMNPRAVIDTGDPYAAKLLEESRGVVMPIGPGMDRYRAEQPFTTADVAAGRALFVGSRRLKNQGAACNSCHTMHDLSAFAGGRLGPDLTRVYERLKGRAAIAAWLSAPATETMQPIFRDHPLESAEIHALTAYFEKSADQAEQSPAPGRVAFLLSGLGVATGLVFLFDVLWKSRFRAVRRPLTEAGVAAVHDGAEHRAAAGHRLLQDTQSV